jgi:uncharacterized protein (TIGR00725 family)
MRFPVIGVMGGGENATPQAVQWAERLGELIAAERWVLLTGGRRHGVMDAASQGAKQAGGLVIGVIPEREPGDVSDAVDVAILTGMGNARNNINVLSSDVVIACGEAEAGTLSEVALAIKARKQVVLLNVDEDTRQFLTRVGHGLVATAATPEEAVELARGILGR